MLRGKGLGLEVAFGGRDFDDVFTELQGKLEERYGFYAGTTATAALGRSSLSEEQLVRLRDLLRDHGIELGALSGDLELEPLAAQHGLRFSPWQPRDLSKGARSLAADFAGARAEIARRRAQGQTSVRRVPFETPAPAAPSNGAVPEGQALYHHGTLRGGQALEHAGNIIVVGDVNPGAELVAGGDILVFGTLRGVAHAGAQGDASARIYALELIPTQLRIAAMIAAADAGERASAAKVPEAAFISGGRIVIVPHDRIELFLGEAKH